jgi:hypothetical protein
MLMRLNLGDAGARSRRDHLDHAAIMPSALHDRSPSMALAFNHLCGCDPGHKWYSDVAIISRIFMATREFF